MFTSSRVVQAFTQASEGKVTGGGVEEIGLPKTSGSTQSYPKSSAPSLRGMQVPESPLTLAGLNLNLLLRLSSAGLQTLHLLHARGSLRVSPGALLLCLLRC